MGNFVLQKRIHRNNMSIFFPSFKDSQPRDTYPNASVTRQLIQAFEGAVKTIETGEICGTLSSNCIN
jgi:hypothetical protein